MIGVKVGEVVEAGGTQTIRTLGRVAADETRIFRLNAGDRRLDPRDLVRHGREPRQEGPDAGLLLRPRVSRDTAGLSLRAGALGRFEATGKETPDQIRQTKVSVQQARNSLENLGMSERQIDEIAKTRRARPEDRRRLSGRRVRPGANVNAGQRFEKGFELYRLADLSHVWILADLFERRGAGHEARTGGEGVASLPGESYSARRSATSLRSSTRPRGP